MSTSKRRDTWLKPVSRMAPQSSGSLANAPTPAPTPAPTAGVSTPPTTAGPFPPFPPLPMPPQMGGVDPMSMAIMTINSNPFIIGTFMLLLNLGGRFLTLELTKKQEAFLQASWIRPLIFFTVVFIATRNIAAAFWVTLFFFFIIWVVANENSSFCMIPSWCGHDLEKGKENYLKNVQNL